MTNKSLGLYIGRFSPVHFGHLDAIEQALEQVDNLLICIGSSNMSINTRTSFPYAFRYAMLSAAISTLGNGVLERVTIIPINDFEDDNDWVRSVRENVEFQRDRFQHSCIKIIGFSKDESSFYLKLFPDYQPMNLDLNYPGLSATPIRKKFFEYGTIDHGVMPTEVSDMLMAYKDTSEFKSVKEEFEIINEYKELWKNSPFPPMFIAVDALVRQSGHLLLIRRDKSPGRGLLAIPGGYLEESESIINGAIRELGEETEIHDERGSLPPGLLKRYLKKVEVFDDPHRDARGRMVTHAHLFDLPPTEKLWTVKGADDARSATWIPEDRVLANQHMMFADHALIIQKLIKESCNGKY